MKFSLSWLKNHLDTDASAEALADKLTNIGLETIVMHFGSPCFVQFLVVDETQHAVYNSSKWWACIQVVTDEILTFEPPYAAALVKDDRYDLTWGP